MGIGYKKRNLTLPIIILSMVFFATVMELLNVLGWNSLFSGLGNFYGVNIYLVCRNILWCIPCFALISYYKDELKFSLKSMFIKFDKKVFILCFGIITILNLITMFLMYRRFNFNAKNIFTIFEFLVVGFAEELIFRGWIFNALRSKMKFKNANITQSIYFMLIHWIP